MIFLVFFSDQKTKKNENLICNIEVYFFKQIFLSRDGRYALNYQRPPLHIDKFDEKRDVFGYVAHLIKMKPGCEQFAVAADIALGGVVSCFFLN